MPFLHKRLGVVLTFVAFGLFVSSSVWAAPCGNGKCSVGQLETCLTCPQDCGTCPVPSTTPDPETPTPTPEPTPTPSPTPSVTPRGSSTTPPPQTQAPQPRAITPGTSSQLAGIPARRLGISPRDFPDGRIILPNEDVELVFTPATFGTLENGWFISFPNTDTDVVFNFSALVESQDDTPQVVIPEKITLEKRIGGEKLTVTFPAGVALTAGDAVSGEAEWDGTFNGPKFLSPAETCKVDGEVEVAVEIGRLDRQLFFTKPVAMEFSGLSNRQARYCFTGDVHDLMTTSDSNGLAIRTTHFTQFLVYKKTNWVLWGAVGVGGAVVVISILAGVYFFRKKRQAKPPTQEYVSTVVHELRTPLSAIKGYLNMLLQGRFGPVDQAQKGPLADVASSAERLSGVVNDMLDIASLQAGKIKLHVSTFALDGVVQEVVASLQPLARDKNLTLEAKSSSGTLVVADRDRTKQILINLLGNSLKFTDKGSVRVSSEAAEKLVKVLVANTGVSIPPDKQKLLFLKFEQLSNKAGGTGLGLHIARELARAMGGDLWLEKSVEGGETVFAFSLPVATMVPLKES